MSKEWSDGKKVAMVKYKSTSNHSATEHPALRQGHIAYKVSIPTTDPFSTVKTIT